MVRRQAVDHAATSTPAAKRLKNETTSTNNDEENEVLQRTKAVVDDLIDKYERSGDLVIVNAARRQQPNVELCTKQARESISDLIKRALPYEAPNSRSQHGRRPMKPIVRKSEAKRALKAERTLQIFRQTLVELEAVINAKLKVMKL